jgi:hypothetical protein
MRRSPERLAGQCLSVALRISMEAIMAYMAIATKYLGPTNYRGSRIKATALDTFDSDAKPKSVTVSMDYALDTDANHERAALALLPTVCNNPDAVTMHKGATKRGYVFVVVPV